MSATTPLDDAEYIDLRSFKKNGQGVDTPVWCAPLDGTLVLFTLADSYKVKRVARNPRVQVARCTFGGKPLGPFYEARCHAVERHSELERRAYAALTAKYGLKMRVGNFFSRLSGRFERRLVMQIELESANVPAAGATA